MRFIDYPFEKRYAEAQHILKKYPDRIPVICEKSPNCTDVGIPAIDKKKYLVPRDLTVGQFMYVIRKRLNIESSKAIFIFVNEVAIPPTCELMANVYENNKNNDGFLYTLYTGETTFGGSNPANL